MSGDLIATLYASNLLLFTPMAGLSLGQYQFSLSWQPLPPGGLHVLVAGFHEPVPVQNWTVLIPSTCTFGLLIWSLELSVAE